ncbi:Hpt domain-containing protein [Natrononativus amylolyticus]|uniref:Hpt domain-containing protein n=1 Tax=Natrononativus amylolyticus TaxID=2963434 RepID=UPI0020CF9204|nr:Hpt domain-containing protein [Natrononativus amylolyticus]
MTDDYWSDFVHESEEHITELNNALLALEGSPDDRQAIDGIFRIAHTLKGNCGAMGLTRASDLAHALEDLLDGVRTGAVDVSPALMDTVFDGVDALEAMIAEVDDGGEVETDPGATIEAIRARIDAAEEPDAGELTAPTDEELEAVLARFDPPTDPDHDAFLARLAIADAGGDDDGVRVVTALEDAFELLGTDPSLEAIENREYGSRFDAVFASPVGEGAIAAALEPVDAVDAFEIVTVTGRLERAADREGPLSGLDSPRTNLSTDDAQELSVDELLDEFEEFDDLDAMVEETDGDDLDVFDEMGEAGSFDDLLGDAGLEPVDAPDEPSSPEPTEADDDVGDDAGAVFAELKDEVEMVGFEELQDELDELEFDEFDSDDEVSMAELLGEDADTDDSFLAVDDEVDAADAFEPETSEAVPEEPETSESPARVSEFEGADDEATEVDLDSAAEADPDDVTVSFEEADDVADNRAEADDATADDEWTPEFDGTDETQAEDEAIADEFADDGFDSEFADDEFGTDGDWTSEDEADPFALEEPADDALDGFGTADDLESSDGFDAPGGADEFGAFEPGDDSMGDGFDDDFALAPEDDAAGVDDLESADEFETPAFEGVDDFGGVDEPAAFDPAESAAGDVGFEETDDSSTTDRVVAEAPPFPIPDLTVPEPREGAIGDESEGLQSVRVDVEQIDSLLTLVEGLVTSRVRLRHAIEAEEDPKTVARELDDLESITSDLQETVMDVRLVPLQTVTNRLPRVVRDIAREQDKEVAFEIDGEDVELDRSILDRIGDPLIHLVRNAVDHGIETPEEREAADKPREGTVEVSASRSRDRVRLVVEDDGSGLDPDRLRDAAVENGVLTGDEAADLSESDAYDLIFHPGLSTAEEVTDVSGRGVGMDVVKRTIERLDGTVSVDSELEAGTTVTMTLPVTVAIADVLFLEAGGVSFGVPVKAVQDIEHGGAIERVDGRDVLSADDADVPVVRLAEEFDLPAGDSSAGMVVRLRDAVRPVALHCETVSGQQEVVVKPFEGFMGDIPGISGATVRGRGNVVSILDVTSI